ncbi:MAG: TAXI family TRAP transporter solute-binding subunit [Alphaproteobacteria bacterium]|nr:TAXI family TRAP transporter solute-binding subunit [Alphaproteobacteria bacterium]MBU0797806.1 TAXI family TRAP transporter solute-binding subunit [Alphaproteobacteria bacterium]MBU0888393.1 TAXI family TRAP transporter solute-binding subunit [Alphaproteobacteria bacterium]MBU1814704.1 TAXI family TRAP transporter solute-binding subunit [Alphaproteobacteria bacterium]MBU2090627.1 TAXI family TRAP transporter solute-binding subunit [Alphaproteobacteria bacterium]
MTQAPHHGIITRSVRTGLAGLALAAGVTLAAGTADAQQRLAMGGTHGQSAFYAYQVAVVSDWNKSLGMNMSIQELGGASASTTALLRGEVDMGIAVTSSDFDAMKASGGAKLRTLYYFAPLPNNWVVAADSGINSLSDLAGKQFNPGGRGSATEKQADSILTLLGIAPDMQRAGGSDALDAYQNRRIIGFMKAGLHPDGYIQQAHAARPIKMIPMTDAEAKKVVAEFPYFSLATVKPGENYGSQAASLTTVQTAIGINTTTDLPEKVAYEIAKRIFSADGMAAAKSGYPAADRADPVTLTLEASVAPLHPGVVRYYTEKGTAIPARMMAKK